MNTKSLTLITAAVLVLALGGYWFAGRSGARTATLGQPLKLENQPTMGSADAPLEVVFFEDFKCPACAYFTEEVAPRLESDYVETGKAKIQFVNFPFLGPDSFTAALAGECVYHHDEAAFWDFERYVFRSQGSEGQAWATPAKLRELAEFIPGVQGDAIETCIRDERYRQDVEQDLALARSLGLRATPSVLVNGVLVDSPTYAAIRAAIDGQLELLQTSE